MGSSSPRWIACALVAACSFRNGGAVGDGGPGVVADATAADSADGSLLVQDGTETATCYGSGLVQVCPITTPPATLPPLPSPLDTSTSTACSYAQQADSSMVCVIAAQTLSIDSSLSVIGQYPLVLLGTDTIAIGAAIDVSSYAGTAVTGPGASWSGCAAAVAPGPNDGGAGGGAGGSFGTLGGNGGTGNNGAVDDSGAAGTPGSAQDPANVRGGCAGSAGALANATAGGAGGNSGGAIYLLAGTSITILATVSANGAGGSGGNVDSGGGGGGTGGLIGLEAPAITVGAVIAANGGGGGGGGDGTPSAGGTGGDGQTSTTQAAAGGATATNYVTTGGTGGVAAIAPGDGSSNPAGGGGGGGAVGVIYAKGSLTGAAMCSPAPALH
ncbi:MAG TPA: hypothetical protein VGF94_22955 [Kofleriaceae bacterium]